MYLSLAPVWDPDLPGPLDQLPHAAAYALLTILLLALVSRRGTADPSTDVVVAVAISLSLIILGCFMELAQAVVGRDVEAADAVANAVGVSVALLAWLIVRAIRRRPLGSTAPQGARPRPP